MNQDFRKNIQSLVLEKVSFAHPGQATVLKDCDFNFPFDQCLWLKSPEGQGKTTFLQILAGLTLPDRGRILVNDLDVTQMSFEEFLPYRLQVGYSFDYGGLIYNRSIKDNLLLPLQFHRLVSEETAQKRVNDLLLEFEIEKYKNERPAHVPGRVRKVAVLLRALVTQPEIVLLDDPSVGLTEGLQKKLVEKLVELKNSGLVKLILMSSYDHEFMKLINHDVLHLDEGLLYLQENHEEEAMAS